MCRNDANPELQSIHWLFGLLIVKLPYQVRPVARSGVERKAAERDAGRARCSVLRVRALGSRTSARPATAARVRETDLENSIASASIYSQVSKGLRWMPWRQEPTKDA